MGWRENEARDQLLRDLILFRETCGRERLIDLLEQELARERVIKRIKDCAAAEAAAAERIAELEERLEKAAKGLEFYADSDNYQRARNGKTSAVERDKGHTARLTLEAIGDEEEEDRAEGKGE